MRVITCLPVLFVIAVRSVTAMYPRYYKPPHAHMAYKHAAMKAAGVFPQMRPFIPSGPFVGHPRSLPPYYTKGKMTKTQGKASTSKAPEIIYIQAGAGKKPKGPPLPPPPPPPKSKKSQSFSGKIKGGKLMGMSGKVQGLVGSVVDPGTSQIQNVLTQMMSMINGLQTQISRLATGVSIPSAPSTTQTLATIASQLANPVPQSITMPSMLQNSLQQQIANQLLEQQLEQQQNMNEALSGLQAQPTSQLQSLLGIGSVLAQQQALQQVPQNLASQAYMTGQQLLAGLGLRQSNQPLRLTIQSIQGQLSILSTMSNPSAANAIITALQQLMMYNIAVNLQVLVNRYATQANAAAMQAISQSQQSNPLNSLLRPQAGGVGPGLTMEVLLELLEQQPMSPLSSLTTTGVSGNIFNPQGPTPISLENALLPRSNPTIPFGNAGGAGNQLSIPGLSPTLTDAMTASFIPNQNTPLTSTGTPSFGGFSNIPDLNNMAQLTSPSGLSLQPGQGGQLEQFLPQVMAAPTGFQQQANLNSLTGQGQGQGQGSPGQILGSGQMLTQAEQGVASSVLGGGQFSTQQAA